MLTRVVSTNARIVVYAAVACQFQKDRHEQPRCEFKCVVSMNARIVIESGDIGAMKVCQLQNDRDEQARCASERPTAEVEAMKVR